MMKRLGSLGILKMISKCMSRHPGGARGWHRDIDQIGAEKVPHIARDLVRQAQIFDIRKKNEQGEVSLIRIPIRRPVDDPRDPLD